MEYFTNKTAPHTQNLTETGKCYPCSREEKHKHRAVKQQYKETEEIQDWKK